MSENDIDRELAAFLGSPEFSFPDAEEPTDAVARLFEDADIESRAKEPGLCDGLSTRACKTAARIDGPEDDAHRLAKKFSGSIHDGKRGHTIKKSANGCWALEYDADGNLIRGYEIEELDAE